MLNDYLAHFEQCNDAIAPQALVIRLPETNTSYTYAQVLALRDTLQARQNTVQACRTTQQIARGQVNLQKAALLVQFNLFTALLDGYFRNTEFYDARPLAPSVTDGQENFTRPLVDAMILWEEINGSLAPAGVTLPLTLGDGTTHGSFASAISALQFAYAGEQRKSRGVVLARARRNRVQNTAYELMKSYREAVPGKLSNFPELIETLPRLSPLPGHTPAAVNASAVFVAPGSSMIVHDASTDAMLHSYQLRGTAGDEYDEEDAVVIATNAPGAPREFLTSFGLNQPGARVAFKVFVILTTDNEAGSAAMSVERPVSVPLAA